MSLALKNICFSYNPGTPLETSALFDIDLALEPVEFVGLMGPSGSGKSTLLQAAAGLLKPSRGSVTTDGITGMVFQDPDHQLFETTLEREVAFAPRCQGLPETQIRERVDEALRSVGLDSPELRNRSPFTLSGGEKRRAILASVLAMDPKYLLLDEPLAGLDAEGSEILLDCLRKRYEAGAAILMASHDPDVICENADRVIRMDQGRILFDGPVKDAFCGLNSPGSDPAELSHVRQTVLQLSAAGIVLPDGIVRFRDLAAALREILRERRGNV